MTASYRYTLTRDGWIGGRGRLCWVMLNPSTADDTVDDPTIRRVVRFTQDHGFASLVVVNLFAARSTKPEALAGMVDPVGLNDGATLNAIREADGVVFAWGSSIPKSIAMSAAVRTGFVHLCCVYVRHVPQCLGRTADGSPRHPLYVAASTRLTPFDVEVAA